MVTFDNNGSPSVRAKRKDSFIEHYADLGHVGNAAQAASISRWTVYRWRQEDADFAARWDDCRKHHLDAVVGSLYEQAIKGNVTAGIFLAKSWEPETYRDSLHISQVTATVEQLADRYGIKPEELEAAKAELLAERATLRPEQQLKAAGPIQRRAKYQDP